MTLASSANGEGGILRPHVEVQCTLCRQFCFRSHFWTKLIFGLISQAWRISGEFGTFWHMLAILGIFSQSGGACIQWCASGTHKQPAWNHQMAVMRVHMLLLSRDWWSNSQHEQYFKLFWHILWQIWAYSGNYRNAHSVYIPCHFLRQTSICSKRETIWWQACCVRICFLWG